MKTRVTQRVKREVKKIYSKKFIWLLSITLGFILSSCEIDHYGYDGRPGRAYLSLSWDVQEPDYLDVGTSSIPTVFYWDEFYRAYPGVFLLYYDGSIWNGRRWISYAWEMEYEIWQVPGEPGGYHYNGADGPDSYFTLVCSPFGPDIYDEYIYYKKNEEKVDVDEKFESVNESGEISKTFKGFGVKIKYRKIEPREKAE